jgi:hypothetical protein
MEPRPRDVTVELLSLDRPTCGRCRGTEAALDGALSAVRPALALAGAGVSVDRVRVDSLETARDHGFEVSPTVRVDGRDVQPDVETTACDCASDGEVPCRVWRYRGETHESAPAGLLADALLRAAYGGGRGGAERSGTVTPGETTPVEAYFSRGPERDRGTDVGPGSGEDDPCC